MGIHKLRNADALRYEADRLDYTRAALGELTQMMKADRHFMLSYLIEMAYIEASDILRKNNKKDVVLDPTG